MAGLSRHVFLVCAFVFSTELVQAQDTLSFTVDSSAVALRAFDAEALDVYRKDGVHNYDRDPKYETNILKRLYMSFLRWLERVFGAAGSRAFWNVIWYAVVIVGIGFLIYFLVKREGYGMFAKEEKSSKPTLEEIDETTSGSDIEALLEEAIRSGQYRMATRLLFLLTLRKLDDAEHIEWRTFKTNRDYLDELSTDALRESFADLSRLYEFVWYGEFDVDQAEFEKIESDFRALFTRIPTRA